MRTKTLLLTAALSAAGLLPSTAQVFSVNVVGYVKQTVPANGLSILAVPMRGMSDNRMNSTIPLPDGYDGTLVFRFDTTLQDYTTTQWFEGGGWAEISSDPPVINPELDPGEAFFCQNVSGAPLEITATGQVLPGTYDNQIPGSPNLALVSSFVPRGGAIATLGFPGADGDLIHMWNGSDYETYQFYEGGGWAPTVEIDPNNPNHTPNGPIVNPGTGFWIQKFAAGANWAQTFSVN